MKYYEELYAQGTMGWETMNDNGKECKQVTSGKRDPPLPTLSRTLTQQFD